MANPANEAAYVSTGALPAPVTVEAAVAEAYEMFRLDPDGETSKVYPALEKADPDLFGICVAGVNGAIYSAGDAEVAFAIMSVSKPFVFALVGEEIGSEEIRRRVGVNATGRPFDSVGAVGRRSDGRTNPMVNAGAIAATSLVAGRTLEARWRRIRDGLSRFAGRPLSLATDVYRSASATNHRNRSIAERLRRYDRVYGDPAHALDLYTRQSSLNVTSRDLAVMGATLADGGVNPVTGERVVRESTSRHTLAVMATAGLYETSGDWLYDVGLPGKSGIGGGIVTVSPGKGALGTFAPRLDRTGNSVKGQLAARYLSHRLGLDLFASAPAPTR